MRPHQHINRPPKPSYFFESVKNYMLWVRPSSSRVNAFSTASSVAQYLHCNISVRDCPYKLKVCVLEQRAPVCQRGRAASLRASPADAGPGNTGLGASTKTYPTQHFTRRGLLWKALGKTLCRSTGRPGQEGPQRSSLLLLRWAAQGWASPGKAPLTPTGHRPASAAVRAAWPNPDETTALQLCAAVNLLMHRWNTTGVGWFVLQRRNKEPVYRPERRRAPRAPPKTKRPCSSEPSSPHKHCPCWGRWSASSPGPSWASSPYLRHHTHLELALVRCDQRRENNVDNFGGRE